MSGAAVTEVEASGPRAEAPSRSVAPPLPHLEKYELLDEIGHGGMATVYRARDPRLGREVAVKLIHRHLRENAEVAARFVAEARAAAKLRHPAIVEVYDVSSEDDAERFLVAELIRGTTLRRILQMHPELPAEVGAAIVFVLCEAVEHAHSASVVHRDIKPENVLVELPADRAVIPVAPASAIGAEGRDDGGSAIRTRRPAMSQSSTVTICGDDRARLATRVADATLVAATPIPVPTASESRVSVRPARASDSDVVIKLTDFGIAKLLDVQGLTSTGQVLGSPAHMAPEQIEGGEVDARIDVFALGVLLYECQVGHLPFEGRNPAQVLRGVLSGVYPAPDRERSTVGGRWAGIVAGALSRDPDQRTASAAELGERIDEELRALGVEDPRAEIRAYFADPEAYAAAQGSRLVPLLVARGECARKLGDVQGAAADFNRALALAPTDFGILKRVVSLNSSADRRRLVRRAAAVLAFSTLLGFLAFQIARAVKLRGQAEKPVSTFPPVELSPQPDTAGKPTVVPSARVVVPRATAADVPPVRKTPRIAATPVIVPPPASAVVPTSRKVKFEITPKGGALSLDGSPRSWFGQVFSLPVGRHDVVVTIQSHCCKELLSQVTVEAPSAAKPEEVQTIYLVMPIELATVSLSGAPQNGQLSCPDLALSVFSGGARKVKLRDATWSGTCAFAAPEKPGRAASVTLKAGEANVVPWSVE